MENKDRSAKTDQMPRERLFSLGADRLTDRELITILLATGGSGRSAASIAEAVLNESEGCLKRLIDSHPSRYLRIPGLGRAKFATLTAALELGRRMTLRNDERGTSVRNARQAWERLREKIPADGNEVILALLLDNRNRILGTEHVSGKRHPAGCDLDLRRLLSAILFHNASGIILAHNHPSGEEEASREDIRMTRDLSSILSGMGTELIDHLIIPDNGYRRINWAA